LLFGYGRLLLLELYVRFEKFVSWRGGRKANSCVVGSGAAANKRVLTKAALRLVKQPSWQVARAKGEEPRMASMNISWITGRSL
jgi:hypothetical protein